MSVHFSKHGVCAEYSGVFAPEISSHGIFIHTSPLSTITIVSIRELNPSKVIVDLFQMVTQTQNFVQTPISLSSIAKRVFT